VKWLALSLLFFPLLAGAEQDAAFVRTKLTNIACWQIRALIFSGSGSGATTSFEIASVGDRWDLIFSVECTEKECVGEKDRFQHFFSGAELDRFLASANASGCQLKREAKGGATAPFSPQESQCLGHALLQELQTEQGLTNHGVDLLRQLSALKKPEFTMQCRDEVGKGWFQKKYEAWFR
jgi:hypothetical protein